MISLNLSIHLCVIVIFFVCIICKMYNILLPDLPSLVCQLFFVSYLFMYKMVENTVLTSLLIHHFDIGGGENADFAL